MPRSPGAVKAAQQATFQAADTDNNGQISKEEFSRALTDPANAAFQILDANGDGQLSQQELQSAGRMIENQLRRTMLPEAPNSPAEPAQQRPRPEEVAPVPNIAVPARPAPADPAHRHGPGTAPARSRPPAKPSRS